MQALQLRCTPALGHNHLPWGRLGTGWSTTGEAAYPKALCSHWASLLHHALKADGVILSNCQVPGTAAFAAKERAALGLFPRASQASVGVDPFQNKQWLRLQTAADRLTFVPGQRIKDPSLPKGSKTISVSFSDGDWWALIGQPVEPEVFLARAAQHRHPQSDLPPLPEQLETVVSRISADGLPEIQRLRCYRLKAMCDKARELQQQEEADRVDMPPHLQHILKGKRLRLFDSLLRGLSFPDSNLASDMRRGFRITGWLPDTHSRPSKVSPPAMHRDEVWNSRHVNNRTVWDMCRSSGDAELDQSLWELTLEEWLGRP